MLSEGTVWGLLFFLFFLGFSLASWVECSPLTKQVEPSPDERSIELTFYRSQYGDGYARLFPDGNEVSATSLIIDAFGVRVGQPIRVRVTKTANQPDDSNGE